MQRFAVDCQRGANAVEQGVCDARRGRLLVDVLQEHHELVAAQSRRFVLGAQGGPDALADLSQQGVADDVPKGVVDALEAVDVQVEQGEARTAITGAVQGMLDDLHEGAAVVEPGELVTVGQVTQPLLLGTKLRDVAEDAHDRRRSACARHAPR